MWHTPDPKRCFFWLYQQAKFTLIWTQAEDLLNWENREM